MRRVLALAVVGAAAGAFSGRFGVGVGAVIVPLLILWLANALPERALGLSFAMLQLLVAFQLARRARRNGREETA
jgi:uncharacterized membrane protein YfcA